MTETAAEALELALWLHRAPARRAMLLRRPLPDGMGQLLRVAGGARDQLEAASAITGQPEAEILEAVRFYLQQVLFHEDADAYRVLGLRPDASHAQAREHHRLLQHWLHPDRLDSDEWESIYAGRVNSAWTRLRTPQARQAYDEAMTSQGVGPRPVRVDDEPIRSPIPVARWQAEVGHTPPDRSRMVAIGVLAGCVGLLLLIALRPDEPPPRWQEGQSVIATDAGPGEVAIPSAALGDVLIAGPTVPVSAAPAAPRTLQQALPASLPQQAAPRPRTATPRVTEVAVAPGPPARHLRAPSLDARPRTVSVAAIEPARLMSPQATVPSLAVVAPATPFVPARPREPDPAPVASIPDPLARMTQARDRARLVVAYLGDAGSGQPPVWNDLRTAHEAERIRKGLHARLVSAGRLELELRESKWRLSADGASLDSAYRIAKEHGRLGIDFVWREDQLLVRMLTVVPAS